MLDTTLISKRFLPLYFIKNILRLNSEAGILDNVFKQKNLILKKNKSLKK